MKKYIKNIIILGTLMVIFSGFCTYAGTRVKKVYFSNFPIVIDGEDYSSETPILNYQNSTYISLREFSNAVGVDISFKDDVIYIKTQDYEKKNTILKLKSTDNVKQINYDELDNGENEIYEATLENVSESSESTKIQIETENNIIVYVSKSGTKYHTLSNCNGATYSQISLNEAKSLGYTACQRCAKNVY